MQMVRGWRQVAIGTVFVLLVAACGSSERTNPITGQPVGAKSLTMALSAVPTNVDTAVLEGRPSLVVAQGVVSLYSH